MYHIYYFAGPIFTEWYWTPIFFIVPTLMTIAASASILYAIMFFKIVRLGRQKALTKRARRIVLSAALLASVASVFLYGGALRGLFSFG